METHSTCQDIFVFFFFFFLFFCICLLFFFFFWLTVINWLMKKNLASHRVQLGGPWTPTFYNCYKKILWCVFSHHLIRCSGPLCQIIPWWWITISEHLQFEFPLQPVSIHNTEVIFQLDLNSFKATQ